MASIRERVTGFLKATRRELYAFLIIDSIAIYWLLFQARLICMQAGMGSSQCYPIFAASSPIDVPAWAALLLIVIVSAILYLLIQTAVYIASRFHIQTR